ncbi:acyltransferase family protein [Runella salmonicolor]|uniref:Acyltransferase n=1 Tax=Runella salmonicolor TaxID=2950278 RepID=A0ABT1FK61_9BACT|nr:acyltransferase [Runella salmonicolor]MCP1381163.1 acyltransferase [Runella salmonicolor]
MPHSNRLLELDALRGIACILVVFFHFNVNQPDAWHWLNLGVAGVDLFFIISGFVIFYSLERNHNALDFFVSRFSRLYPAYWVAVCITSALVLLNGGTVHLHDFLVNLTMLQGYFGVEDIDGSYWTLGIELFFYCLAILPFITNTVKWVEHFIWISLFLVYNWHYWGSLYAPGTHAKISNSAQFLNHAPLFFAGIFFYLIGFKKATPDRYFGVLCCFILSCYLHNFFGRSQWVITIQEHVWMLLAFFGTFFLLLSHQLGFLVNRVSLFLGNISYSLYLIHQRISTEIIRPWLQHHLLPHMPNLIYSLIMLACSIGVASAINFWIELPAMRFLRQNWKRLKTKFEVKQESVLPL